MKRKDGVEGRGEGFSEPISRYLNQSLCFLHPLIPFLLGHWFRSCLRENETAPPGALTDSQMWQAPRKAPRKAPGWPQVGPMCHLNTLTLVKGQSWVGRCSSGLCIPKKSLPVTIQSLSLSRNPLGRSCLYINPGKQVAAHWDSRSSMQQSCLCR